MLYILDKRQKTVGVAFNGSPNSLPYFNDEHYETLDGISTYEFIVPANHPESDKIEVNGHVIIADLDKKHILFTIKEVMENYENNVPVKRVKCENTAIDELLGDVVRPFSLTAATLEMAVTHVLNSSVGWSLGDCDYLGSYDVKIDEYVTVLEALRKICEVFNAEMYFTVELQGTEIIKKKVNVVKERGRDTGVRFDYGHHLRAISRTENSERVCTAIVAVGKGDSNGKRIDLTNIGSFNDGDIYHDVGTDWIGSLSALQRWSKDGHHIFGIYVDDEADTDTYLKERAIAELKRRIEPSLVYSTSLVELERVTGYDARKLRLGDRIVVKDTSFSPPIIVSARVQEIKRSYTNPIDDEVSLGNYQTIKVSVPSKIKQLQSVISRNEEKWNKSSYKVEIYSSNGLIFKDGNINTVLEARVYRNGDDVTDEIDASCFRWTRTSNDTAADEVWNSQHSEGTKTITITADDVRVRATFNCQVDIEN